MSKQNCLIFLLMIPSNIIFPSFSQFSNKNPQMIIFKNMNPKHHKKSLDLISCCSTQQGNLEERDEELLPLKTNSLKHKTELCKNFTENGWCPYNNKCRFAHGTRELVNIPTVKCFRKKKCNGFWSKGFCTYGKRCQFGHEQIQWEIQASLKGINCVLDCNRQRDESRVLKMLIG